MNLLKIYYILPSQLCVVFISLQGQAQISKERENVNFNNKSQQFFIFLYFESRFCILRF